MADTQSRKWQVTLNNPAEHGFSHEKIKLLLGELKPICYYCLADELGLLEQTPHTHIFLAATSGVRFSALKKRFPTAHMEQAHGTSQENRDYIAKEGKWAADPKADTSVAGTFEEWGEMPVERQGARTDLQLLYELVRDGKSNFEILEAHPDFMLSLTGIERTRQTLRAEQYAHTFRQLTVTYLWGPTGTGKTRSVMEEFGYCSVYRVTDYDHPFDAYTGQDVLVLEEYRSQLRIAELLNYLDGYPLELPARYANKVACFTQVFLISNVDLKAQYPTIQLEQPATWAAFLRRITTVRKFFTDGHHADYSTEEYLHGYVELEPNEGLPF